MHLQNSVVIMKMVKLRLMVSTFAVIAMVLMDMAMAANYTVGGANGGWDQSTDLATWAASQTFVQGDTLIFQYTLNHDVTELSAADFASCSTSNPVQPPQTGGTTVVPLTSAGSRYFTCTTAGHCIGGMKVQIDTIAASTPPPSTTPSPPPATTPAVPSPPPAPTPTAPAPPPASPPPKSAAPTPPPKRSPPPKGSPPSKTAASTPAMPPSPALPPSGVLLPPPAPSSAAKFDGMGSLIACSGFALMMLFNL